MGTFTAQILVGTPHPNHGGIIPTHYLFLSENDRPAWILENKSDSQKVIWIPTVEDMLEDALLMIAIHVCKDSNIINLAKSFCKKITSERVEVYSDLKEAHRKQLYQQCRALSNFPKIIVSVFEGSTIRGQLSVLKQYQMEVEVCVPIYSRLFIPWTGKTTIKGSL